MMQKLVKLFFNKFTLVLFPALLTMLSASALSEGHLAEHSSNQHTFKSDETLWFLAQLYYGDGFRYREIIAANHLKNENDVRPGQVLEIPNVVHSSNDMGWQARYMELYGQRSQALLKKNKNSSHITHIQPAVKSEKLAVKPIEKSKSVGKVTAKAEPEVRDEAQDSESEGFKQEPKVHLKKIKMNFDRSAQQMANEELGGANQ